MSPAASRSRPSALVRAALMYAQRFELCVLPLLVGAKEPLGRAVPHGYLEATTDPEIIEHWWELAPNANVGIACAPSEILVIDVDPRNGGDETFGTIERRLGSLPATWTTLTPGGGQHYYFRHDSSIELGTLGDGIDIKWNGYVVAPPSVHPNGGRYLWDVGRHPTNTRLALLPEAWHERMLGRQPRRGTRPPTTGLDARRSFLGAAFCALGWLGEALPDGRRIVRCPWASEHTDGRGQGRDSSTVLFSPLVGSLIGGFHCAHGHCKQRKVADVLRMLPPEAIEAAARMYPTAYRAVLRNVAKQVLSTAPQQVNGVPDAQR